MGTSLANRRKFVNPQTGLDFGLGGPSAWAVAIPPAARIDGAENSAEIAELYWMPLLRDVCLSDYGIGAGTGAGPNNSGAAPLTIQLQDRTPDAGALAREASDADEELASGGVSKQGRDGHHS